MSVKGRIRRKKGSKIMRRRCRSKGKGKNNKKT